MDFSLSFNANYPIVEQQLRQQQHQHHQQLTCTHCVNVNEGERKRSTLIFLPFILFYDYGCSASIVSLFYLLAGWLARFFPFTSKWKDVVKRQWRQSAAMNEQSVEHTTCLGQFKLCVFFNCALRFMERRTIKERLLPA